LDKTDEWIARYKDYALRVCGDPEASPMDIAVALRQAARLCKPFQTDDGSAYAAVQRLSECEVFATGLSIRRGLGKSIEVHASESGLSERFSASEHVFDARPERRRADWESVVGDGFWVRSIADADRRYYHYRGVTQRTAARAVALAPERAVVLISLQTGSGKSLCALAPAAERVGLRRASHGTCVFVAPTLALMDDQHRSILEQFGLPQSQARRIWGGQDPTSKADALGELERGSLPFVLMPPETALADKGRRALLACAEAGKLRALIVDEAHLVTTWGAGFRPAIQRMGKLRRNLSEANPSMVTVLLSATATDEAESRLHRFYTDGDDPWLHIDGRSLRSEHDYVIARFDDHASRVEALLTAIDRLPRPAIVYTTKVDRAEEIYQQLNQRYRRVALFTGRTPDARRRDIVRAWANGDLDLVVGTSAFGLGVDNQMVRTVVHAELPETLDRFYQETGRGGRDGYACLSLAMVVDEDLDLGSRLQASSLAGAEKSAARWVSMRENRVESDFDDDGPMMVVDLGDRAPHVRAQAQASGAKNRGWNEAVLLLMERAGLISIEVRDEAFDRRIVRVIEKTVATACKTEVESVFAAQEVRERSQHGRAIKELCSIFGVAAETCINVVLARCYNLPPAPPCGRCQHCLHRELMDPAILQSHPQVTEGWGQRTAVQRRLVPVLRGLHSARIHIPSERTSPQWLAQIVTRLASAGVEQFVAGGDVAWLVDELNRSEGLGLVARTETVGGHLIDGFELVPTCIILPTCNLRWIERAIVSLPKLVSSSLVLWLCADDAVARNGRPLWDLIGADASWSWELLSKCLSQLR
jgi:ATP-dependent DNA helicase RecQ